MRTLLRKLGGIASSFPILIVLAALCVASIFIIMSATVSNDLLKDAYSSQSRYIIIGFALYLLLALTPYEILVRIAPILYCVGIALLVGVFVPGLRHKAVFGAYSWLKLGPISFEPAEFAKLTYILGMAWFLHLREREIHYFTTVVYAFVITAIPFVLIKMQPALGSALVFFPVCFAMLFVAGARLRYIVLPILLIATFCFLAYYWVSVKNWPLPKLPFTKSFQAERIKTFFDPSLDKQGAAWQINQSMIAIGSGGMNGKGWMQGTQNVLGYMPKTTNYNDFIFSDVGEEEGFRGGAALIICEGTVLLWCLWVAARARDKIGAMVAVGVMAMLFTHIFVNIGMTIQVVPITGIPLPFISYGGTFLLACLAAMGLVQSVWVHRKNFERI
ncbi:MAG: rod shape-determining protein RodA [Methylacidiphilales bacterium]|nr:rod shape-determining protein RodA [Candidatus Methylacidiphilales bacterium]